MTLTAPDCATDDLVDCRSLMLMDIMDAPHPPPDRLPQRTNKMMFVFAANPTRRRTVLPGTYQV